MKSPYILQNSAITTALLMLTLFSPPVLSQAEGTGSADSACLTAPRKAVPAIRRVYNCTNETEFYRAFDRQISVALERSSQRERLEVLATGTNNLLSQLSETASELQTAPASEFIQSMSADLQRLSQYFTNPDSIDFTQIERLLVSNRWAFSNKESDGHLFHAYQATRSICKEDSTTTDCLSAIAETAEVASLARLANRINTLFNDEGYELAIAQEKAIITTLENIEANTPFQYPWELLLNRSWLDCSLAGRRNSDFTGSSGILTKAPDCQFILFHTDAAFGYSPDSTEGAKSTEALVIELAGFMTWKFQETDVENAWGMSLATTLADLEGENNDIGLGVTFRYGKFGLTASKHRGDMLYLLNLELFDIVSEKATDFAEYIK